MASKHSPYPGDIVEARLEPGEMVINRNAVNHYGKENLEDLNESVPRFQEGAVVDPAMLRQQNDLKMAMANQYSHGGKVELSWQEKAAMQRSSGAPQSVTAPWLTPIGEPYAKKDSPGSRKKKGIVEKVGLFLKGREWKGGTKIQPIPMEPVEVEGSMPPPPPRPYVGIESEPPDELGRMRIPAPAGLGEYGFKGHSIDELRNVPRYKASRHDTQNFPGQVTEAEQMGRMFKSKTYEEIASDHPQALALARKEYPGAISESMIRSKSSKIARDAQHINQQKFNEWKSREQDITYSHARADEKRIEEERLQSYAELNRELYKDEDPFMRKRRQKREFEEYAKARNKSKPESYASPKKMKVDKVNVEQKFGLGESLRSFGRGFHKQLNPKAYKAGGGYIQYPDGRQGYLLGSLVGLAGIGAAKKYGPGLWEGAKGLASSASDAWNRPAGTDPEWSPEDEGIRGDIPDDPNEAADLAAMYGEHLQDRQSAQDMGNVMAGSEAGQWGAKTAQAGQWGAGLIKEGGKTLLGGALGVAGAAKTGLEGAHKYMSGEGWGGPEGEEADSRYKSLGRGVGTGLSTLGTFLQEAAAPGYIDQQKQLQALELGDVPSTVVNVGDNAGAVTVEENDGGPKPAPDQEVVEEVAVDKNGNPIEPKKESGFIGGWFDRWFGQGGDTSQPSYSPSYTGGSSSQQMQKQYGGYIPYATGGFVSSNDTGSTPSGLSLNNSRRLLNFARRQYG